MTKIIFRYVHSTILMFLLSKNQGKKIYDSHNFLITRFYCGVFMLLAIASSNFLIAQSPYGSASHTKNCSSFNMYIGAIEVKEVVSLIFNKANDGCNQSNAPNYTLMSTSPSFTLSEGCTYSISFTTGNAYATQIGVWIDLNIDNDFDDTGEFISKGWANINPGSTLQTRNFVLPCGLNIAGNSRMRIRSDSAGSTPWNSGAACATVAYGETEDYAIRMDTAINPVAGYTMNDTVYVGIPVYFVNNNRKPCFFNAWDIEDNGTMEYLTLDAAHVFHTKGRYCVKLKTDNCKGRSDYLYCFDVLAPPVKIENIEIKKVFHFYPNPASNAINLVMPYYGLQKIEFEFIDLTGQIMTRGEQSITENQMLIKVSSIPNGIYSVRLFKDSQLFGLSRVVVAHD